MKISFIVPSRNNFSKNNIFILKEVVSMKQWITKNCLGCDKTFEVTPARKESAKFCSRDCANMYKFKFNTDSKKKISEAIKALHSNNHYTDEWKHKISTNNARRGNKAWNSDTCIIKTCPNCSLTFKAPGKRKYTAIYCSHICRTDFLHRNKDIKKRRYYIDVWKITNRQPLHLLENIEKRGKAKKDTDNYQVDHIIPIIEGYKNNIPASVIGDISNLRMIHWKENIKRQYENKFYSTQS